MAKTVMTMPPRMSTEEWQTRLDLAACYRLVDLFGWSDLVNTRITARVPGQHDQFLLNPYGLLFDEITASSLVKIDAARYRARTIFNSLWASSRGCPIAGGSAGCCCSALAARGADLLLSTRQTGRLSRSEIVPHRSCRAQGSQTAASAALRAPRRTDNPRAGDNRESENARDDGEPVARCRQCAGAAPIERRQDFGRGGDARRGMTAAKVAAFRLDAKPELDRRGRSGGGDDAQQGDERRERRDGRERDDEGPEDACDHGQNSLGLGAKYAAVCNRSGRYQIRRILAGDGEPSETAG